MTSRQKRKLTEFLFLLPTLIAFLMVIIIPFIFGIYYSFTDWQGTGAVNRVVGFENYKAIFQDPGFLHSFLVTLLFTVLNIITVNVVAFLISLLVTSEIRGRNVYRAGFFVPNLIGGIVLGLVWQFIFSNILPSVGQTLGLPTLSKSLISNKDTVMITLVTVNTWQYAGYIMLIYVASIQGISKSVMEAAEVDGARYWTRVGKIRREYAELLRGLLRDPANNLAAVGFSIDSSGVLSIHVREYDYRRRPVADRAKVIELNRLGDLLELPETQQQGRGQVQA